MISSNVSLDDEILRKLEEKFGHSIQLESEIMKTEEYNELFTKAQQVYPNEYDYIIHMACISYFQDKEP